MIKKLLFLIAIIFHFYDKMNETFMYMAEEGVIKRDFNDLFKVETTVEGVLDYLESEED